MHCVLLNSPCGDAYWRIHRSVEVLGYHEQEVRILLALYLENLAPTGTENYLGMMHRGHVECKIVPAWPLPQHPDEVKAELRAKDSILRQLYEPAFTQIDGRLVQLKGLTTWDTWHSVKERRVIPEKDGWKLTRSSEIPYMDSGGWVPFTTWRIGPFTESAFYLITCVLGFTGETYRELVDRESDFTVDGPMRLLARVRDDLLRLPQQDRARWVGELARFECSHLLPGDGYDVIILAPPLAEEVRTSGQIGIASAPLQPDRGSRHLADRFIASDQRFSMVVEYAVETPPQPGFGSVAHLS